MFAAAEDFTDLINESTKMDDEGVGAISNKDKSNAKQLKWEMNRFNDDSRGKFGKKDNKFGRVNKARNGSVKKNKKGNPKKATNGANNNKKKFKNNRKK